MAPEIMLCMDYTESVDVFSFGLVLVELITGAVLCGLAHTTRIILLTTVVRRMSLHNF
jgi:serine/threonine protein kinase